MFVEPDADGTIPEHPDNTSRRWLQTIGNRLAECETNHDRAALEAARRQAGRALNQAVKNAMHRGGMELVGEVMSDVGFRGWH